MLVEAVYEIAIVGAHPPAVLGAQPSTDERGIYGIVALLHGAISWVLVPKSTFSKIVRMARLIDCPSHLARNHNRA
jgi:hypothetical protein